ncbi:hypothetical protein U1Q18_046520 [Sarracenia purpurea var. burkii]
MMIRLHKLLGNKWSLIAGRLPGRTANDVKNYWNTHLKKKIMFERQELAEAEAQKAVESKVIRPQARTISRCGPWRTGEAVNIANNILTVDGSGVAANSSPTLPVGDDGASWWERMVANMEEMNIESGGDAEASVVGLCDGNIEPPVWATEDSSIQEKGKSDWNDIFSNDDVNFWKLLHLDN